MYANECNAPIRLMHCFVWNAEISLKRLYFYTSFPPQFADNTELHTL